MLTGASTCSTPAETLSPPGLENEANFLSVPHPQLPVLQLAALKMYITYRPDWTSECIYATHLLKQELHLSCVPTRMTVLYSGLAYRKSRAVSSRECKYSASDWSNIIHCARIINTVTTSKVVVHFYSPFMIIE